jgi:hypothetical protein
MDWISSLPPEIWVIIGENVRFSGCCVVRRSRWRAMSLPPAIKPNRRSFGRSLHKVAPKLDLLAGCLLV